MNRQAFKQRMQDLKSYREQNPGKGYWDFKQQQAHGPYSAGELVKSIEEFTKHEEYLGPPSHNYDFTLSEEWADKHGYYPDERGHRDDRVKKEAHPTHPSKGKWKSQYLFDLTDKGFEDPNFILYGLNDGGQDLQATMTYREGIVLPELTVTPKGNYIYNSYDNIKAYQPGGETGEDPGSASLEQIEQREWLRNWLSNRTAQMADNINTYANQVYYGSSHDRNHVLPFFFQNKEKNAANVIQEQLQWADETPVYDYREPWTVNLGNPYEDYFFGLPATLQGAFLKEPGKERAINISPITKDRSAILHELSHATQDKYEIQTSKIAEILKKHGKELPTHDKYYDNPNEIYSRMNQFRHDNGLKPSDVVTEEQIEQWKKSSIDNKFIKRYSTNTLLDLLNTVADANSRSRSDEVPMAKDGLQTGNDTPVIGTTTYNNYGDITHNIATSFSDDTLNLGLPDIVVTPRDNLDLAGYVNNRMNNAARFGANIMDLTTPVGDVHQLYDVVNDTRSGDYLSAGIGLAALALPFSPMTVKQFRSLYRGVTPKGRTKYNSKLMDQLLEKKIADEDSYFQKQRDFYDKAIEDRNEVYDTWVENEDAFRRAVDFDKKYGTQYKKAYSDELKAYAKSPYSDGVTKIGVKSLGSANGKFYPEEPDWIFLNRDDIPMGAPQTGVVNHEMGHKIDSHAGVINRDGTIDKKLFNPTKFKSKEELLKQYSPDVVDRVQSYLLNDSEVKSHMNAFRTYLRRNKMLDPSGKENLKDFKKKLFDSGFDNLKILFNTYKKPRTFVRDFNAIPITKATTKTDKELV